MSNADLGNDRYPLHPYPAGWYFLASSQALKTNKLLYLRHFGRDIVVWRDLDDKVCAADPQCPHLGASLTPAAGGKISNGQLVCPFHGFTYDTTGRCVATPNAKPPPSCSLSTYPVIERNGFVFLWWSEQHTDPLELPELDEAGWTAKKWRNTSINTHLQEIAENSVDLNHFLHVHSFHRIHDVSKPVIKGAYFQTKVQSSAPLNFPLLRHVRFEATTTMHLWGLGYFLLESYAPRYGLETRSWLFSRPIESNTLMLSHATSIKVKSESIFQRLTHGIKCKVLLSLIAHELATTIEQDRLIWSNKQYREYPMLVPTDGQILAFRRYCKQFYPEYSEKQKT